MKNNIKTLLTSMLLLCAFSTQVNAGLKIYYIRHAEGGHNVKTEWERKGVPKSEWPSYVGNPDVFTPRGEKEVIAATEKLKAIQFDFVASSPAWRARNTILPFLKITQRKAEIWPELREGPGMNEILSKEIPDIHEEILNQGKSIILPEEEMEFFTLRADAENNYSTFPKESDVNVQIGYLKHASLNAISVIEKRFGVASKTGLSFFSNQIRASKSCPKGLFVYTARIVSFNGQLRISSSVKPSS